jgi:hypothetical protein
LLLFFSSLVGRFLPLATRATVAKHAGVGRGRPPREAKSKARVDTPMMSQRSLAPILFCLAGALVALLVHLEQDMLLMYGLGLISVGIAVCWTFSAKVAFNYNQLDEGDQYEIGADAAGTIIGLSLLSLSLLWLAICAMIIASRAVGHKQPLFTAEMLWQVKAFAAAQSLGILLVVTSECWLPRRATDELE